MNHFQHPLALAILTAASDASIDIPAAAEARALGGKGVTATVEGRNVFLGSAELAAIWADPLLRVTRVVAATTGEGRAD